MSNTTNNFPVEELERQKERLLWIKNLKRDVPTYPLYRKEIHPLKNSALKGQTKVKIEALVRIKRNDIYYLIHNRLEYILDDRNVSESIDTVISMFHQRTYILSICYVIDNITFSDAVFVHAPDTDQREESVRLREDNILL